MEPSSYAIVEMVFSFGVILAIGFWQLGSVARAKKKRLEREAAMAAAKADTEAER